MAEPSADVPAGGWSSGEDEAVGSMDREGREAPAMDGGWPSDEDEPADVHPEPDGARPERAAKRRGRPPGARAMLKAALAEERARLPLVLVPAPVASPKATWDGFLQVVGSGPERSAAIALQQEITSPLTGIPKAALSRAFNRKTPRRSMTTIAEAEVMGIKNAGYVRDCFAEVATGTFYVSRIGAGSFCAWLWSQIDKDVLEGDAIIDCTGQDETSMPTGERDATKCRTKRIRSKTTFNASAVVPYAGHADTTQSGYAPVISKIMQSDLVLGFLVHRKDTSEYILYWLELPCGLQRTQKGNHRQIFCALEQNATLPLLIALEEKFTCRLSLSNADKGATGLKTDRLYESLYPLNPRLSGLGCTSHRVNSAQKAQMEVCSETYAGTVAFSLAHNGDGSWAVFRRHAADILFDSARTI